MVGSFQPQFCYYNEYFFYLYFLIDSELFVLDVFHFDHQDVSGRERLNLWTQICFSDLTGTTNLELL